MIISMYQKNIKYISVYFMYCCPLSNLCMLVFDLYLNIHDC